MTVQLVQELVVFAALTSASINAVLWSVIGILRKAHEKLGKAPVIEHQFQVSDIAAVIAARNEELALPHCLRAITAVMPAGNVFVGNDASTDATAQVVPDYSCNVYSAPVNIGKSRILDATIKHFDLCNRFSAILILDADSQVDTDFLRNGLPLLGQKGVAVVAGHVVSRKPVGGFGFAQVIHNYRKRLNFILQTFFRFGQSWAPVNFTIVAPGFASIYRSGVLAQLNIAEPGLIIEDINMTFEVHKKRLGRIAYAPSVRCTTEDPITLHDYSNQMRRWSLGLWQTMVKQRVWPSKFWTILGAYVFELLLNALSLTALATLTIVAVAVSHSDSFWMLSFGGLVKVPLIYLPFVVLVSDLFVSALAATMTKDWRILIFAPLYPLLRIVDVYWFLTTIPLALFTKSDGRWNSPVRSSGKS